jgi:hypothetical protein
MSHINVYCDGSICDAVMTGPFESHRSGVYVARMIVLVLDGDLGLIEQTRSGILTDRGTPNSSIVELLAIRKAFDYCASWEIGDFVIYSDSKSAVREVNSVRVRWAPREEMYLPNAFFDRVFSRASYIRNRPVKRRQPVEPHQLEIFELFQSARREFRLSQSPLWARITKDLNRHPRALQKGKGTGEGDIQDTHLNKPQAQTSHELDAVEQVAALRGAAPQVTPSEPEG